MDYLRDNVFFKKFDVDDRETLFHLGNWSVSSTIVTDPFFVMQFLLLIVIIHVVGVLVGIAAYHGIVKGKEHHQASVQACLLGYGILLPILSCTPYWLIRELDIRNCLLLINLVGIPVLLALRLVEALHGSRLPEFAKTSLPGFVLYFSVPLVADHDFQQPVRSTWSQWQSKIAKSLWLFLQTWVLFSALEAHDFAIFPERQNIFYWGNIANNFLAAALMSLGLDLSCSAGEAALCIVTGGIHFADSHLSPMSASTSVSQFWGQRWNRLVANSLRRGAFGPLKRVLPRPTAAVLTFLASGLVHEYMLFVLSSARDRGDLTPPANNLEQKPYRHQLGHQFGFFLWNGVLLVLEKILAKNKGLLWIQNNAPQLVRTALVLLLVLPISDYFTDEYNECGIFRDASMAFPRIEYQGAPNAPITQALPFDGLLLNYTVQLLNGSSDTSVPLTFCPAERKSTACTAVQYLFGTSKVN
mmetsp:Transcript_6709/g.14025  ORF Transcript_6709/g.14025 Transcript_6709/m.14025 type:complete len:471 (-) Transcript_6709:151-1563(-)|eukprot:CAMPEP_0172447308 /NCGR_PEP_ID=MMETSP1065-20121228/6636_1 /TAXON_ID=265537 /ORGANISM="Amphiprora paludosa, Strain CCMP125" /LENGTH=470 /DNA_ID=CAMNT_0013198571 /DNA_START=252 /DNA_END=1664 /DNA_ORIENTATION=-